MQPLCRQIEPIAIERKRALIAGYLLLRQRDEEEIESFRRTIARQRPRAHHGWILIIVLTLSIILELL